VVVVREGGMLVNYPNAVVVAINPPSSFSSTLPPLPPPPPPALFSHLVANIKNVGIILLHFRCTRNVAISDGIGWHVTMTDQIIKVKMSTHRGVVGADALG